MSSVSGARPVANSTSSASTSPPSSRVTMTGPVPPGRRTAVTVMPIRTSTPASARARPTSSPANGSIRAAGRRPGQQGDRGTQALPRAGHFHADPAADDDGQPSGHGAGAGGVPVGPRSRLGQAGQFGQGRCAARPRAGRSEPPSRRPGWPRRPGGGRPAGRARGSVRRRGLSARRPAPRRSSRSPIRRDGRGPRSIHRLGDRLARPGDPAGPGDPPRRPRHGGASPCSGCRPSRSTRPRTGPIHRRDAEPGGTRTAGGGVPNRPGTNQDHVVGVLRR